MQKIKNVLATKKAKFTLAAIVLSSLISAMPLIEPYVPPWAFDGVKFAAKLAHGVLLGMGGLF